MWDQLWIVALLSIVDALQKVLKQNRNIRAFVFSESLLIDFAILLDSARVPMLKNII